MPQVLAVVAAIIDELHVLAPGDRLGVDLELRHFDLEPAALLRECEAGIGHAQLPGGGRNEERLAHDRSRLLLDDQRQAERLGHHHQLLAAQVFMEQREPVEVETGIGLDRVFEQLERAFERVEQVGLGLLEIGEVRRPAVPGCDLRRIPPLVGLRFDRGQSRGAHRTVGAEGALRIAPDPPFREPADVACQPNRGLDAVLTGHGQRSRTQRLFVEREKVQRVVARIDQRQRKQFAAGTAHVGRIDRMRQAGRQQRERRRGHGSLWRAGQRSHRTLGNTPAARAGSAGLAPIKSRVPETPRRTAHQSGAQARFCIPHIHSQQERRMQVLLKFSRAVDWLNAQIGKYIIWLILASTVISGINAAVRKVFNMSSNAFLEVQWYLFAASFLIAAGYTLLNQEHVKIDVISSRLSKTKQIWIDIIGFAFFLTPVCLAILWYGIPFFLQGYRSGEMSNNAGGLIRWPVYAMIPLGFTLLMLQGWSELIKRIAFLQGRIEDPTQKHVEKTAEEELAESIRRLAEAQNKTNAG
jgi:TRAP-type mannitol/chloroaromatic compound transport system permease small subunit